MKACGPRAKTYPPSELGAGVAAPPGTRLRHLDVEAAVHELGRPRRDPGAAADDEDSRSKAAQTVCVARLAVRDASFSRYASKTMHALRTK